MSKVKTILFIIIVVLISIFAVQNYADVPLRFMIYQINISQAIIIVASTSIGVIIGLLSSLRTGFKSSKIIRDLNTEQSDTRKKYDELKNENAVLQSKVDELTNENVNLQMKLDEIHTNMSNVQQVKSEEAIDISKDVQF